MNNELETDAGLLRRQSRLLHEAEHGIRVANREIIHGRIAELDTETFVQLAHVVARLRADYLKVAVELSRAAQDGEYPEALLETLAHHRRAYDEGRAAFEALQRAIEQGYVDVGSGKEG